MLKKAENDRFDSILGRSLLGAEALLAEIRERLEQALGLGWERIANVYDVAQEARRVLEIFEPLIVQHISDTELVGWVHGMNQLANQFPPWLVREFQTGIRSRRNVGPPPPPSRFKFVPMFGDEPRLRFPLIENAAKRLFERNILNREEWDSTIQEARDRAFMISGDIAKETIADVRRALVDELVEGTSLTGFKNRVRDVLEKSAIGPARIETIYRTNIQAAFRDGRETLASDPIVSATFPYQEYIPIHDTRTRSNHLKLGELGLNGTGIYRRDDPFWSSFTPPIDFNCRCGVRMMTIDAAARAGVVEAQKWLATGRAPPNPEYRLNEVLKVVQPKAGFGSRGRTGVTV